MRKIRTVFFTKEEINIISCIINGRSAKFIAALLKISINTVNYHMKRIMLKTECHCKDQLISFIEASKQYPLVMNVYANLLNKIGQDSLKRWYTLALLAEPFTHIYC